MVKFLQLTKSRLRRKILSYYFTDPAKHIYLRQLAVILREDPGNLSKELSRLKKEGIFNVEIKGNQKYFYLNEQYTFFQELKSIISKSIGVTEELKRSSNASRKLSTNSLNIAGR
jgi:predicted transcriptional regulator with HTH domain